MQIGFRDRLRSFARRFRTPKGRPECSRTTWPMLTSPPVLLAASQATIALVSLVTGYVPSLANIVGYQVRLPVISAVSIAGALLVRHLATSVHTGCGLGLQPDVPHFNYPLSFRRVSHYFAIPLFALSLVVVVDLVRFSLTPRLTFAVQTREISGATSGAHVDVLNLDREAINNDSGIVDSLGVAQIELGDAMGSPAFVRYSRDGCDEIRSIPFFTQIRSLAMVDRMLDPPVLRLDPGCASGPPPKS